MPTCCDGVTIGIPNWNHEYLLPRSILSALESVKELRERGIEADVLVVDDGSRDGSLTLLRQLEALYYKDGLHVLALKQNNGLGAARNQILLNTDSRYVLFLDADNELISHNTHSFYRAVRETGAAVVYGNLITVKERANLDDDLFSYDGFQSRMFSENYIDAFSLVDRLQVLDCGGFSTQLMQGREDWELYLHLAALGRRVVFVPIVLGIYYFLSGSLIEETRRRISGRNIKDTERRLYVRVFNQLGIREHLPLNTRQLRYHPDIGYF